MSASSPDVDPDRLGWPLPDERHIEAWIRYAHEGQRLGAFTALRRRLVQLRFPIQAGISQSAPYRAATRQGRFDEADAFAPGLRLVDPASVTLSVEVSPAGRVPVLTAPVREDFVTLVCAFTERNEPVPVPASMGACFVKGLTNWDRVAALRQAWEQSTTARTDDAAWHRELQRLAADKASYQDTFIILSGGVYSNVAADELGLDPRIWLERSLAVRLGHELLHYLTWRVFGYVRSHVVDELVADFAGLGRAFGAYDGAMARRFLGLEGFPAYRAGGRLENYGAADDNFEATVTLTHTAVENLERLSRRLPEPAHPLAPNLLAVLVRLTLAELADREMPDRVLARRAGR